jgi:hypothetical protein
MYNVKDPGVVLYAKEEYAKGIDTWSMLNTIERWNKQDMFRIKGANLYMTQDLSTTRHINKQSKGLAGMRFLPLKVDVDTYNNLLECYKSLGDSIIGMTNSLLPAKNSLIDIKRKQLVGKWEFAGSEENINYTTLLNLKKDGTALILIDATMELELDSNSTLKMCFFIKNSSGQWNHHGAHLLFEFNPNQIECEMTHLDITGLENDDKEDKLNQMRNLFEQEKENIVNSIDLSNTLTKSEFVVNKITKESLIVNMEDKEVEFTKIK